MEILFDIIVLIALISLCAFLLLNWKRNNQIKKLYSDIVSGKTGMKVYYYDHEGEKYNGVVHGDYNYSKSTVLIKNEFGKIEEVLTISIYPSII